MKSYSLYLTVLFAGALTGCATVTTPVAGKYPPITPRQAQAGAHNGQLVRWGGQLIQTTPEASQTCFTVMAFPLSRIGRPEPGRESHDEGRFLACAPGFYDPTLYSAGREMSFVGTIQGVTVKKVGGYEYPYPRLEVSKLYLWPLPEPVVERPSVYLGGGWGWPGYRAWGWWGPAWGWGYP